MAHDLSPEPTRERDLRVHLDATVTRPTKRGRSWTVEAGRWRAEGRTEKDALAALTAGLQQFLGHYQAPKVFAFRGHVAVLSADLGVSDTDTDTRSQFQQQVVHPQGRIAYSGFTADGGWDEAQLPPAGSWRTAPPTGTTRPASTKPPPTYRTTRKVCRTGTGRTSCTTTPPGRGLPARP